MLTQAMPGQVQESYCKRLKMENRATIDQMSMSIAGRSLSRMSPAELNKWKSDYQALVSNEDKKSRRDKGEATGTQIKVKF